MVKIDKWMGSKKVAAMRPEEEGAYFRLLCFAADSEDGSLPDDDNELAALSRLREDWFETPKLSSITRGDRIRACFYVKNGRLRNETLDEDIVNYELAIEQKRQAGAASGERRRQRKSNGTATGDERALNGRSFSVEENHAKTRTEYEREGNGEATDVQRALISRSNENERPFAELTADVNGFAAPSESEYNGLSADAKLMTEQTNGCSENISITFEQVNNVDTSTQRTDVERPLPPRSISVDEKHVKKRTEGQREGNGKATAMQPLPLPLPTPPSSSSPDPKPDDDDDGKNSLDEKTRQVQHWLTEYTHGRLGEAPPDIARKVLQALGDHTLDELQERLVLKLRRGHQPQRTFAWFVSVVENEFPRCA